MRRRTKDRGTIFFQPVSVVSVLSLASVVEITLTPTILVMIHPTAKMKLSVVKGLCEERQRTRTIVVRLTRLSTACCTGL